MTFNFIETCILNQTMTSDNRSEYISFLTKCRDNTTDLSILSNLDSLIEKLSSINDADYQQVRKVREDKRLYTWPPYCL